ncbi:MAG: hypothetical protein IH822_00065 [Chloroflexi bacterium]|nr:hypothetical protein [Chloroflexota bacterium]
MLTALIIATTATALVLAIAVITVLTGWFPRLAALAALSLESLLCRGEPLRLNPRDRAELIARLWVP